MRKIIDYYLALIISANMLMALTIVCAPHSSMKFIESLMLNAEEQTQSFSQISGESKPVQLLGNSTGTIEFNR